MIRVRLVTSGWVGGPGLNTWYFGGALSSVDTVNAVVERVRAAAGELALCIPSVLGMDITPDCDIIDPVSGNITDTIAATTGPFHINGGGGNDFEPPSTMLLMRLRTATFVEGRRVLGRAFIGPVATARRTQTGQPSGALSQDVTDAGNALILDPEGNLPLVVWHRPVNKVGGLECPVISASSPNKYAVLRSRRD